MTNQELLNLAESLANVSGFKGQKFSYFVARNMNLLNEPLKTYNDARLALLKSCAKKDGEGNPITEQVKAENGAIAENYVFEDKKVWDEEIKKLLSEQAKPVEFYKLSEKDLPADITGALLVGIFDLINIDN